MANERLIPINIVGAKVTSMAFMFDNATTLPEFSATVALVDDKDKTITSMSVDSRQYCGNGAPCEKSAYLIELAAKTRIELNTLITRHMNSQQKILDVNVGGGNE